MSPPAPNSVIPSPPDGPMAIPSPASRHGGSRPSAQERARQRAGARTSPRLRRRERRLLRQELAQGLDARRARLVRAAQEVVAERRRDAQLERRDEAPGGQVV